MGFRANSHVTLKVYETANTYNVYTQIELKLNATHIFFGYINKNSFANQKLHISNLCDFKNANFEKYRSGNGSNFIKDKHA